MNLQFSILVFPPSQQIVPPPQLQQYENNCKAIFFFIMNTYKKIFKAFKKSNIRLKLLFERFVQGVLQAKAQKITAIRLKNRIYHIKRNYQSLQLRARRNSEIISLAQKRRQLHILIEWSKVAKIQQYASFLNKITIKRLFNETVLLLRQNKERRLLQKLSIHSAIQTLSLIYAKTLKKKSFEGFRIHSKMRKIQHMLTINRFKDYIIATKSYNKQSQSYSNHRLQKLVKQSFWKWKEFYQHSQAYKFHKRRTLSISFQVWRQSLDYLVAERELDKENEYIVSIFRQRKDKDRMMRILHKWRDLVNKSQENRHHNFIITRYADLKYKEILLKRHFQALKQSCIHNKVKTQFYQHRLTRKAFDSLKLAIYQSVQKQEKVILFMQKMQIKKYFDRIIRFNEQENKKANLFRLNTLFGRFTLSILYTYYSNVKRAESYYCNNLLYKCLYTLKQESSFTKKEKQCITFINIILPLRRWLKRHRLQQYLSEKEWICKKKVVRQWRLLVVRRDSQKKIIKQFRIEDSIKPTVLPDSKVEDFQFDNIMATIAKIRQNFMPEGTRGEPQGSLQSINFSYSLQNVEI